MFFLALINNITLIISLIIFYSVIIRRWKYGSRTSQVISGFLFGAVAVIGMINPLVFAPGLIFDGRSIIISAAGFTGGWVSALIAALMAVIYRAWLGGTGAIMGLSVITASALTGVAYYYFRNRNPHAVSPLYLYGFGVVVHIFMLAAMLTLPSGMKYDVFSNIAGPVIIIYPLATLLVCVVLLDLESRLRVEEALRESEALYRTFINATSDMVFLKDEKLRNIVVNQSMAAFFGKPEAEVVKKSDFELLPEDIALRSRQTDQAVLAGGALNISEEIIGDQVYEIRKFPVELGRNRIGVGGFIRNITERKRTEEAVKKSEEMLRLITENMSDMIRVTDLQGTNIYASSSHFKTLGYRPEERIGSSTFDVVHPDDIATIINRFAENTSSIQPIRIQYRVKHAGGHYVWLDTVTDRIRNDQGEVTGLVMSSRDITEQKQLEEERRMLEDRLLRAEKMEVLGQLAGGVAHDLNNVLGVLTGYSELLMMEIPEGQRTRMHAEKIMQSAEKGAAIIQDLLTLARRGVMVSEVVNLNDLVSGFLKTPVFEKIRDYHPRVTFRADLDESLLYIKGSPVHLEKTLMNLISNAAEAISGVGEVIIRTESRYLDQAVSGYDEIREGDYSVLTVTDTGTGISDEHRGKIFEPFFTKKTMGRSGTGLGLAIVWGTVKDHNGYIDVRSRLGEGSAFTLFFPATREEKTALREKKPVEQYKGRGESVLVVDDIAEQREVASVILAQLGYRVHAVSDGEEAVNYLRENKADILVLDMIMPPGIDGLTTFQKILEINPKQKAVIVSGFSETERVREAQRLGAGAYVKKPYVMEKIGIAIYEELRRP